MVGYARREDLGLVFKPAERVRVNDSIAIALKFIAVRMRQFGIPPA